jgi:hypothetical protein
VPLESTIADNAIFNFVSTNIALTTNEHNTAKRLKKDYY